MNWEAMIIDNVNQAPTFHYKILPTNFTQVIARDSVGVKIDPTMLFQQGKLRVVLTDHSFGAIEIGNGQNTIAAGEIWQATILFVHRKNS